MIKSFYGFKGGIMTEVTISPKYQVVIPKEVRKKMTLRKGQKMMVVAKGSAIILMPNLPLKQYRGFLKGMKSGGIRDKKDRV